MTWNDGTTGHPILKPILPIFHYSNISIRRTKSVTSLLISNLPFLEGVPEGVVIFIPNFYSKLDYSLLILYYFSNY
jgi:hypothetical protein